MKKNKDIKFLNKLFENFLDSPNKEDQYFFIDENFKIITFYIWKKKYLSLVNKFENKYILINKKEYYFLHLKTYYLVEYDWLDIKYSIKWEIWYQTTDINFNMIYNDKKERVLRIVDDSLTKFFWEYIYKMTIEVENLYADVFVCCNIKRKTKWKIYFFSPHTVNFEKVYTKKDLWNQIQWITSIKQISQKIYKWQKIEVHLVEFLENYWNFWEFIIYWTKKEDILSYFKNLKDVKEVENFQKKYWNEILNICKKYSFVDKKWFIMWEYDEILKNYNFYYIANKKWKICKIWRIKKFWVKSDEKYNLDLLNNTTIKLWEINFAI